MRRSHRQTMAFAELSAALKRKISANNTHPRFLACLRTASAATLFASARDTACLAMTADTVSTSVESGHGKRGADAGGTNRPQK